MRNFIYLYAFVFLLINATRAQNMDCVGDAVEKCHFASHSPKVNLNLEKRADANIDIKYYKLKLEVDPAINFIKGRNVIYFKTANPTNQIQLNLRDELLITGVYSQNYPNIQVDTSIANVFVINFNTTLPANHVDSVEISYNGVPPQTGFGSFNLSRHNNDLDPVMWTLSEPYGAEDWWPCKNSLTDKADSIDIVITCPSGYRVGANGLLISETTVDDKITYYWKHRYPIASYLVAFAVTNYSVYSDTVILKNGPMEILNYVYPEDLSQAKQGTKDLVNVMIEFEDMVGAYPFWKEKYGHAQFGWGGGMEHQTMTFVINYGFELLAHELGHQWFGDKITCGSWQDIWLNEGFATYMSGLAYERIRPIYFRPFLNGIRSSVISQPDGSVYVTDTANVGRIFNSRLSYRKGAYILHMLRWVMGDTKFFEGLKSYTSDTSLAYSFARVNQFREKMEQKLGTSLVGFFDDWYYGQGFPTYNIQYDAPENTSGQLKIRVNQTQSHASVSFYEMPLPIKVFSSSGVDSIIRINNTYNGQLFTIDYPYIVDSIQLDPDIWVLRGNGTTRRETIISTSNQSLSQFGSLYPNPCRDILYLDRLNIGEETFVLSIKNIFGAKVLEERVDSRSKISVSTLPVGLYLVELYRNNESMATFKILKSN